MRQLAKLALRIFAIILFFQFVQYIAFVFYPGIFEDESYIHLFLTIFPPLIYAVLLWIFAGKLSAWILKEDKHLKIEDMRQLQVIAFSVVGLFITVYAISSLLDLIVEYVVNPGQNMLGYFATGKYQILWANLVNPVVNLIIGVFLLFCSRPFVTFLNRKK